MDFVTALIRATNRGDIKWSHHSSRMGGGRYYTANINGLLITVYTTKVHMREIDGSKTTEYEGPVGALRGAIERARNKGAKQDIRAMEQVVANALNFNYRDGEFL